MSGARRTAHGAPPGPWRVTVTLWVLLGAFAFLMASMVVAALRKPAVLEHAVTAPGGADVGDTLVGPLTVTLDATSDVAWTYFDFSRNSAVRGSPLPVPGSRSLDWDLAVRRFHIIANGGTGFAGQGGIGDLGPVPLDAVREAPEAGYQPTARDSTNAGVGKWYRYGYASHILESEGRTYALRTADGKYALFTITSYYCEGAVSGCFTLRYLYQGDGSRGLTRSRP